MDIFEIIESLSKTSSFNTNQTNKLLSALKTNLEMDSALIDPLIIRSKISGRHEFADAQADCDFL